MAVGAVPEWQSKVERLFEFFPVLAERRDQVAGYLSGGERQMLAISQALLCDPKLLLVDELSLGLAPHLVNELMQRMREPARRVRHFGPADRAGRASPRSPSPTTATSWKAAASSTKARRTSCAATRTCRSSISAPASRARELSRGEAISPQPTVVGMTALLDDRATCRCASAASWRWTTFRSRSSRASCCGGGPERRRQDQPAQLHHRRLPRQRRAHRFDGQKSRVRRRTRRPSAESRARSSTTNCFRS